MDGSEHLAVPGWELALLALLFLGSFFFSGTETALTSLGEAKARQLRERLGHRGRILGLWIDHPRKVLTALLIGNNLVNVASSAVATKIALDEFQDAGLAIATGVMTLLLLVFGEITPKTLARERYERVAVPSLWLLRPFYVLVFPFSWLLARMSHGVSVMVGSKVDGPLVSSEDVDFYIELSAREGALGEVKEQLLTSVVEFTDLLVKEIMIPRTSVAAVDVNSPLADALDLAEETGHTRLPVYNGTIDEVVGILSVKDVIPALRDRTRRAEAGETTVEVRELSKWLRPSWFAPEVMKVSDLLTEMQKRRSHLAIVVDEFGGTSGIVTLEDVVEELVGEIQDEHDHEVPPIVRLADGHLLVEAALPLRDLEDELGIEFPDDGDYESLGGFVVAAAGAVPPPGERLEYQGFEFVVRESDERRVLLVEVCPPPSVSQEMRAVEANGDGGANGAAPGEADAPAADGSAKAV